MLDKLRMIADMVRQYRVSVERQRGQWVLRVTHPDGHRTRQATGIPAEDELKPLAETRAAEEQARLRGDPELLTLARACWLYVEHIRVTSAPPETVRKYETVARRNERMATGVTDGSLRASVLLLIRDRMLEDLAPRTVNQHWGLTRAAWEWCAARDHVAQPWPEFPPARMGSTAKRPLTEPEVLDLLAFAAGHRGGAYHVPMWALAESAARVSEVLALDVGHLGERITLTLAKTGTTRDFWPSPPLLAAMRQLAGSRPADAPIFLSPATGRRMLPQSVWRGVRAWAKARGIEGQVDLHSLRRRGVALLQAHRVPIADSQALLGHASPEVHLAYARNAQADLLGAQQILWVHSPGRAAGPRAPKDYAADLAPPHGIASIQFGSQPIDLAWLIAVEAAHFLAMWAVARGIHPLAVLIPWRCHLSP